MTRQEEIWDAETAQQYDTPGTGMFARNVLGPTVDRLVDLAGGGRARELAIGTGRVAVPLSERGVPVTGIELSVPMIDQLRTKVDADTISNLLTQEEQVACFRNAARHLTPGGRFVVELWVPELRALPPGRQATVWHSEPGYIGLDTYDVLHQRIGLPELPPAGY